MRTRILFVLFIALIACSQKGLGQVNLQSGGAEINIPLYQFSDTKNRLATAVSLVYTAGNGLIANEVPSSVGTGWILNAGGMITREQKGEPDDQKQYSTYNPYGSSFYHRFAYYDYIENYYPNGYLYSEFNVSQQVDNGGGYVPLFQNSWATYKPDKFYLTDREQDVFVFSFNGRTGKFIIGKNGQVRTLVDSKLKIEKVDQDMHANNIITTISEFRITDETGIKYVFKEVALNELMKYEREVGGDGVSHHASNGAPTGPAHHLLKGTAKNLFVINKWYLSEIVNPLTNKKIIFAYEAYSVDMPGKKSIDMSIRSGDIADISFTLERIKGTDKRLTSIECSAKEKVVLVYNSSARIDLPFDKSLSAAQIKYDNVLKYSWTFSYGYFVDNQVKSPADQYTQDEIWISRLCLQSVQQSGINNTAYPPYTFSYYVGTMPDNVNYRVPPIFSKYQDHWGYYAPSYFASYDGLRDNFSYSNIDWSGLNAFYFTGANTNRIANIYAKSGVLRSIQYPTKGTLDFEYELNAATTVGSQQVTVGGIRASKTIQYDAIDHAKDIIKEYKYLLASGLSSGWGYEIPGYSYTNTSRVYKCNYKNVPSMALQFASVLYSGIRHPEYLAGIFSSMSFSFGQASFNASIIRLFISILVELFSPAYVDHVITYYSTSPTWGSSPLPFQYSRVEVTDKLLSNNIGKTIYEFTSDQDFALDVQTLSFPYASKPRFAYWAYGLPKSILIKDKNELSVKKTETTYSFIRNTLNDNNFLSQKWRPTWMKYDCFSQSGQETATNNVTSDFYYPIYGRTELTQTREYTYNSSGDFATTTTDYEYSPNNYLVNKIKSANSKSELAEVNTYYPQDYTLSGAIQLLKDNNMFNIPISSQALITKNGSQKYVIGGSVSEFSQVANGDLKVSNSYKFRSEIPVSASSVPFNAAQLLPSSTYYKQVSTITYNAEGLPVQINTDQGKACNIYDYDNMLNVATVANAEAGDVAFSSFEGVNNGGILTQQVASGGWLLNQGSNIVTDRSFCGTKSFSGRLDKTLTHTGNYTVTLWNLWNVTVNGQNGTLLATSNGNWKLMEWKLTNVSSIVILADNVDDVRVHPTSARMTSFTYDPLFGKSSECDPNNRTVFYQYDALGRLKIVRDEQLNVIKAYEYNFKQ